METFRPLILRSNRFLGSALAERDFVSTEDLELANEKLLEALQNNDYYNANLLQILLYDIKSFEESLLVEAVVEESGLGLIDLSNFQVGRFPDFNVDIGACRATATVPFDQVEDFVSLATAYYLSRPAVQYWTDLFEGKTILWFISSTVSINQYLERAETELRERAKEAEQSSK